MKRKHETDSPRAKRQRKGTSKTFREAPSVPASETKLKLGNDTPQILDDQLELDKVQASIKCLRCNLIMLQSMVQTEEETMERYNPEPTNLAIQETSAKRNQAIKTLQAVKRMHDNMLSLSIKHQDLGLQQIPETLELYKAKEQQLRQEIQAATSRLKHYLVQLKEERVLYSKAEERAKALRSKIAREKLEKGEYDKQKEIILSRRNRKL
ncbi:hypothetical protein FBEOM_5956 [Fusarium beomiforme]|uniref:Uncharacterized protein n=1 Tax=Fusarium beomiforme TaxID=44412 RepID=A0A9P5AK49_9HYPO|nr:hypothetical protein FBEOM_5956 [Fusarium beomiforme]